MLGWELLLLPHRPAIASALLGVLAFKPQMALLLPVALIAGKHWRAVAGAALSSLGLSLTSVVLFGGGVWSGFRASLPLSRRILESGLVPYYKMQSVFAAVRLLGGSPTASA